MHVCKQDKCKVNGTYHSHLTSAKALTKNLAHKQTQQDQRDFVAELFAGLSWLG